MLTSSDITQMQSDLVTVRQDNEISITIRRGATTLPAQPVRIARAGSSAAAQKGGDTTQENRQRVVVMGSTSFDVQPGDRFNDSNGVLFVVNFVRPNRVAAVTAEAEAVL